MRKKNGITNLPAADFVHEKPVELAKVNPDVQPSDLSSQHCRETYIILTHQNRITSVIRENNVWSASYLFKNFPNKLLCGFCKAHSTQHALFKLLHAWQKELDKSVFIGTILMNLSKAYNCLPHNLLIAKLGTYGLERSSFP